MPPQQPHFPQRNDPAPDETPTIAPVFPPTFPSTFPPRFPPAPSPALDPAPLPPLDKSPTGAPTRAHAPAPTSAPTPARPATRPPSRRIARPTVPIQPPTLPGLEDDIRAADAEVRSEARSRALVPAASPVTLAPTRGNGGESTALLIRGAARPPRPAANVVPRRSGPRSFLTQFLVAYEFDSHAERTGIASLMRRLADLGIAYKDLSTHQSSLEDIFVELVHQPRAAA